MLIVIIYDNIVVVYSRKLDLGALLQQKNLFLFGPRTIGKTTLLREQLPEAKVYNLLEPEVFARLNRRPALIGEESPPSTIVALDEIQKAPILLDQVHHLIESQQRRFLLTGSSARKLRRGVANLLGGRAWETHLLPLSWSEIPSFDLLRYLNRGGLPAIYDSDTYERDLRSYVSMYLREEVAAEGLTRNIPAFAHFLEVMGLANGEELNFHSLASDVGVPVSTLKNYVQILADTLIGFSLPGYTRTKKRKAIARAKHYLFDLGVTNCLAGRGEIRARSELFGKAFEQFIIQEVRAYTVYADRPLPLTYWRSTSQFEVDLLVGNELAIEIKATDLVSSKHLTGLRALGEEKLFKRRVVVSLDPHERAIEQDLHVVPWQQFLERLWHGQLF